MMGPIDFRPLVFAFILVGVIAGLLIAGLLFGGCKLVQKYQIKIDEKPLVTNVVYVTSYVIVK